MLDIIEHIFNLIIARAKLQGYVSAKFSTLGSQAAMVAVSHATSCSQALGGNVWLWLTVSKIRDSRGPSGTHKIIFTNIFEAAHFENMGIPRKSGGGH